MGVEAMVMTEMLVMMPVTIMIAVMVAPHPGMGIEHARMHVDGPDTRGMRGAARPVRHRRRRNKNGSRKHRGGNHFQHGRVPPEIARWAGRMAGPVDHGFEPNGRVLNPI